MLRSFSNLFNSVTKLPEVGKNLFPAVLNMSRRHKKKKGQRKHSGHQMKVTVIGAVGNIGMPLSLMLKQSPLIDELSLYDVRSTGGFAGELSHIDTKCRVTSYTGKKNIKSAMDDANVVVMVAAAPRTSFLSFQAMFESNGRIMEEIACYFAQYCPKALLAIATNPVNSLVPLASEVIKMNSCYNPRKVFGVTTIDIVRANTFVAQVQGLEPECVMVPVIGGHADSTIIPILSQARPCTEFTNEELEKVTRQIQCAHDEIIRIKCIESATLSAAFAIARFVISLVKGLRGQNDIVECAFVRSNVHPNAKYLSTPIKLGPNGMMKNYGLPAMTEYENCQLENAIPLIMKDVRKGERFVGVIDPPPCDPCDPEPRAPPCPPDWCEYKKRRSLD